MYFMLLGLDGLAEHGELFDKLLDRSGTYLCCCGVFKSVSRAVEALEPPRSFSAKQAVEATMPKVKT